MTGEAQIARGALIWSAALALPSTLVAFVVAGPRAATSVALAAGIILVNVALAAGFAVLANSRFAGRAAIAMSLPSLALRLTVSLVALQALKGRSFIDEHVFVAAFCVALGLVLVLQARAWKRTPWLAQAFGPQTKETV